ncbi:AAA family ATPase [Aquimarina gracilis]|uniref:AAA family ATPase n=1 Tax=Aquimarina gracilis TaxID=874422 RepID=A0ABU5ZX29_9FLAO|nr:AAA family ATPase [Aquimarina gracilis]MEB3346393.1 AAA family ATPase [Aquimarina gracilis]
MIAFDTKIQSPFKFLESYKKKDVNTYFGRDHESQELFELYKDSSIMILHGPSGSGKTSLIYCGLLNKIRKDKEVISIRRDDNLISSIKKRLFVDNIHKNDINPKPSELIEVFFSHHTDLNKILVSLDHTESMMLDIEEEVIRLKRNKRTFPIVKSKINDETSQEIEETETLIKKNKERLSQFIEERKKLLEKLRQKNKEVSLISSKIHDYFMYVRNEDSGSPFNPLVIFDQFEELFVYGSKEEIDKFGLFLKLIFDYKIPFNVIISLREEYFGYLDQLQSYIPYIFYKKLRLAHPNELIVKSIIEKSFRQFNINQISEISKEELPDSEKEKRIELILDQIKIVDNENVNYHLPFLQVYLDSIYKVDYGRTYGETPHQEGYLPLEFKEDEIKEFGSIEQVLENYIREVNNKIIRNTSNKLNSRTQHRDSVIKFLRHFKTKDDLKKRIPVKVERENYYVIGNRKLLDKMQTDIWGNVSDADYNDTISEIIYELKQNGILHLSSDKKIGEDYAELSHDIIAKIISNLRTEDDFRSLIKKDFISSFDIYDDTKQKADLLSAQQVQRMQQCLDYIMDDDNDERLERKQQFFEASIEESQKEERENKRLKRRLRLFFYYPFIITCLLGLSGALYFQNNKSSSLNKQLSEELETNELSIKIHKGIGYALRDYNVDKTSSFNYIMTCEWILWKNEKSSESDSTFNLLSEFKNDLYKDYNKTPFYQSSIQLPGDNSIIATKTRRSVTNDSILYVFALTKSKSLILNSLKYKKRNATSTKIFEQEDVIAFEPFLDHEGDLTILVAKHFDKDSLKFVFYDRYGKQKEGFKTITIAGKPTVDIEHQKAYSFIVGIDNMLKKLEININSKRYSFKDVQELDGRIRKIKTFKHDSDNYLVLYGSNNLHFSNSSPLKHYYYRDALKLSPSDSIHTFKIKSRDSILLGLKGRIKVFNPDSILAYDNFIHDERINTIDVNDKGEMLVGSRDNGANLWSPDNILLKQFIGHNKPIQNVSFVNKDEDYIITSSEDQTIKIWNIKPIAIEKKNLNDEILKIEYQNDTLIKIIVNHKKDSIRFLTADFKETAIYSERRSKKKEEKGRILLGNLIEPRNRLMNKKNKTVLLPPNDSIDVVTYSKPKDKLAVAARNNIYLYDVNDLKTDTISTKHDDRITQVEFSSNSDHLVSGSMDNKARIWKLDEETDSYALLQTITSHTGDIEDVKFYKDSLLLTASSDHTVQIYRKNKDRFIQIPSVIRHDYPIKAATFSTDGKYIISGDEKGVIKKWDFNEFDEEIEKRAMKMDLKY